MRVRDYISLFLIFNATLLSHVSGELRDWTNAEGNIVKGTLLSYNSSTFRVRIKSNWPSSRVFWYSLENLSSEDRMYVLNHQKKPTGPLPNNLYNDHYYETVDKSKWKFYDKKFCDIRTTLDYEKMLRVSASPNRKLYTPLASVSLDALFEPDQKEAHLDLVDRVHAMPWHCENRFWQQTGGFYENINVLCYFGLTFEDFKKLRWFFSREDLQSYPEKIYKLIGVLDRVVKKFEYDEFIEKRMANGIPVMIYLRHERGSAYSCKVFGGKPALQLASNRKYKKIIYFKTRYDAAYPLPTDKQPRLRKY